MTKRRSQTQQPKETTVSTYEQPAVETTKPTDGVSETMEKMNNEFEGFPPSTEPTDLAEKINATIPEAEATAPIPGVENINKNDVQFVGFIDPDTKGEVVDVAAAQENIGAVLDVLKQVKVEEPVAIPVGQVLPTPVIKVDPYQLPLSCSAGSRLTIEELKDYIRVMSAKVALPAAQGGQAQSQLYHILIQAINARAEDFDATFGLTIRLIRDNLSGVFSMEDMHRYTPHATLPAKTMAHFRYLLSVLTALADPALQAEGRRQTNLDKAFRTINIKEDARQRVLNFFNF
jgi:hypothetical protein